MKIAIVGKGGSGKSTVSTLLALEYARQGRHVLAIDADYNMDLAHNLGRYEADGFPFLNRSGNDFYEYLGLDQQKIGPYIGTTEFKTFSLDPKDSFTKNYTKKIHDNIDLMITGDFHQDMLYGDKCNHAFIKPLKLYIPLLQKKSNDIVLIDSVAGTDMMSFGLYLGADLIINVVENNRNSLGVAQQMQRIATEYGLPIAFVANKTSDNDIEEIRTILGPNDVVGQLSYQLSLAKLDFNNLPTSLHQEVGSIIDSLQQLNITTNLGMQRHLQRKQKHEQYLSSQHSH